MQHALSSPLDFGSPQIVRAAADDLDPPPWARELLADAASTSVKDLERADSDRYTLITARIAGAADMSPADVEQRTAETYARIAAELARTSQPRHAVRFWNHVPFITDPADNGRDNYMVFNAGRFRAFSEWLGSTTTFQQSVATASAIGHWGADLIIHCLAADTRGVAVSNPRQVAPYHYSQRFGPLPPCFSRATRLLSDSTNLLLVGGTASIRGEDSMHGDDLIAQCRETFVNLAALLAAATNRKQGPTLKPALVLAAFRELRVYYPDPADEQRILWMVRENFPALSRIELFPADLCRAELLVEIEGVAELNGY